MGGYSKRTRQGYNANKRYCSNNPGPVGGLINGASQDKQYLEYSCDSCKIYFNNKIEFMKHKEKGVCIKKDTFDKVEAAEQKAKELRIKLIPLRAKKESEEKDHRDIREELIKYIGYIEEKQKLLDDPDYEDLTDLEADIEKFKGRVDELNKELQPILNTMEEVNALEEELKTIQREKLDCLSSTNGKMPASTCAITPLENYDAWSSWGVQGWGSSTTEPRMIGKRVINNRMEFEKYKDDIPHVGKAKSGNNNGKKLPFKFIRRAHDAVPVKEPALPIELYNKIKETERTIVTKPSAKSGITAPSFYRMAEDVYGPDYNLDWIQVGVKVNYKDHRVPIVEVWDGGVYWVEYEGTKVRLQTETALYRNLDKSEMDYVIKKYNNKHTKKVTVSKESNPPCPARPNPSQTLPPANTPCPNVSYSIKTNDPMLDKEESEKAIASVPLVAGVAPEVNWDPERLTWTSVSSNQLYNRMTHKWESYMPTQPLPPGATEPTRPARSQTFNLRKMTFIGLCSKGPNETDEPVVCPVDKIEDEPPKRTPPPSPRFKRDGVGPVGVQPPRCERLNELSTKETMAECYTQTLDKQDIKNPIPRQTRYWNSDDDYSNKRKTYTSKASYTNALIR